MSLDIKTIAFFIIINFVGTWVFFSSSESSIRCFIIGIIINIAFGYGVALGLSSKEDDK